MAEIQPQCRDEDCILPAEPGAAECVFHVRRDGKSKQELVAALNEYTTHDVKQIRRAYLRGADLSGLYIDLKNFQYADLTGASFESGRFFRVGFDYSTLDDVNFENAIFDRVDFRRVESAKRIAWFNSIFESVELPHVDTIGLDCIYDGPTREEKQKAAEVYRNLKEAYRAQGHFEDAGMLYEREMDLLRRLATRSQDRLWLTALWLLTGYGERPGRAFLSFLVAIVGFAGLYTLFPMNGPEGVIQGDFLQALYFSVVTFTSLGYGDILPQGFARMLAGMEALLGIFLISLFVFTFCRKMIR